MRKHSTKFVAVPVALALAVAACGSDGTESGSGSDDEGTTPGTAAPGETTAEGGTEAESAETAPPADGGEDAPVDVPDRTGNEIIVTGPERDESEAGSIQDVLTAYGEENGIQVTYLGDAAWETNINTQLAGGNPPDISFFPQPGKLADFARSGDVKPLADVAATATTDNWPEKWTVFGNVDGTQYGVPNKSDVKSLVWYQPARFEAAGYEIPETFEEFTALVDQITADGEAKALCVGIESGPATGWTFTDWTEDMVLRQHGPDVYDQWVSHEIPFNDPQIVESMQTVLDLWSEENVFASSGTIAATAFQDNGQPLVDGNCFMHRQASFFSAFIPEGTPFADGSEEAVDVFYFPDVNDDRPLLSAGTLAAAFNERPEVHELLAYLATPEYATARQTAQAELKGGGEALSGFLSAVNGQEDGAYQPVEQNFLEILDTAEIVRFDGSDLMPAEVGSGSFWTEGTSAVNGDQTAEEAADAIEASWPES